MSKRLNISIIIASSLVVMLGFQNCAPAKFGSDQPVVSLKTEGMVAPQGLDDSSDDIVLGDQPIVPDDVAPDVALPVQPKAPRVPATDKEVQPELDSDASNNVVECDLKGPKTKIVLSKSFQGGSNWSASRVCMSENACLKIMNEYASARNCSLAPGAATSAPAGQCTAIFPGSKGTCKNAKVLSDADVTALLAALAAP